jgi:ComF family protein
VCGDPVDGRVENVYQCSHCRREHPAFDNARSAVRYRGAVRKAIHKLKYGHQACMARDLAKWLVASYDAHYKDIDIDAVIYVPLYLVRQRERTYNQSSLLSREFAKLIKVPLFTRCVKRIRPTGSQVSLNARQRSLNVKNAFEIRDKGWVDGKRLLLIDDVMTTGATVNEIAKVLKEARAASVHVLTVARG